MKASIVSFRLGGTDGVSVVATTWERALIDLGFAVTTIAGTGKADRIIPALAWPTPKVTPPKSKTIAALQEALAGIDVVIVENLCSLPLNPAASEVVAEVLAGRPAVLHHHDLAWQRPHLAHITGLPPDDPAWRHVTINELSRRELGERGITARVIFNGFDVDAPLGKRDATRTALGIEPNERVVLHPVRAIERKGVPAALALAEALDATYWLTGPAEEDYELMLSKLLANARVRVLHVPSPTNMADAYAAADVIAFPSTWEGFGNPLIEAANHRRPLVVSSYPVAEEIRRLGFKWFEVDDAVTLEHFLDKANDSDVQAFHDHNTALARSHFSYDRLRQELGDLLSSMNFTPKVLL